MSWHCEDASINFSALPAVRREWHEIVRNLIEAHPIFDDWGMFAYTNGAYKPWGDYLTEIDVGIWEQELDDDSWRAWVQAKHDIAAVSLKHGGSITACHGSCCTRERSISSRGARRRLRGHEEDQAGTGSKQRHEPGEVPAGLRLRG